MNTRFRLARPLASALAPALVVAIASGLTACTQPPTPEKVEPPRPVRSLVVAPSDVGSTLTLPGELRPRIETRYGFRVAGKLASRSVSVGDRVRPGAELARLDPADVMPAIQSGEAQALAVRTELEFARAELARQQSLRDRNFISTAQLERQQAAVDGAAARLEAAQAQLRQARNALDFQVLKSDVAGVVVAVEAEAGQVVAAGQPVLRIAQLGEIEVVVNIPESDLAAARNAIGWEVTLPALGNRTLPARLRELSPLADSGSRTYAARLALRGEPVGKQDGKSGADLADVALGMSAIVRAERSGASAFLLPVSALFSKDDDPRVWVVDPSSLTVQPVAVKTAGLTDEGVRIVAGLNPGDRVVTAGANMLVAGQKVRLLDGGATR